MNKDTNITIIFHINVCVGNDFLLFIDSGNISILTLLDLSVDFHTIDHDILLLRLEHVSGISGTLLSWFKSYL